MKHLTLLLVFTFLLANHVNCQLYVTKSTYYPNENCTGEAYTTFFQSTSACTYQTPKCLSFSVYSGTFYYIAECASEIPTTQTVNYVNAYIYKNSSCVGALKSVQISPMNSCIRELATTYYTITDSTMKTYYSDSKCSSKLFPISLYAGTCLSGGVMYMTSGTTPSPTPTPLQYERVSFYNGTISGAASCSAGVNGQIYRPVSSCSSASCQSSGNNFYQKKECTSSITSNVETGTFQIHTYLDQNSCSSQQSLIQMEVYSIDTCSPYSLVNNNTELLPLVYIKSDGCNVIRKYNDSSCSNVISKVDMSLNSCGVNGLKYLCVSNNNGGGNNGGITVGNSTRVNSTVTSIQQSLVYFILLWIALLGM